MTLKIKIDLVEEELDILELIMNQKHYSQKRIDEVLEIYKETRKRKSMNSTLNYLIKEGYLNKTKNKEKEGKKNGRKNNCKVCNH